MGIFVLAAVHAAPGPGKDGPALVVSIAVAGFPLGVLGRNGTSRWRNGPAHRSFVALILASAVALMSVQPAGPGAEGVLLGVLCAAVLLPGRRATVVLLLGFAVVMAVAALTVREVGNLAVLASFAALYGMLYLADRLAGANLQAELLLAELKHSQTAQAESSRLAERQHLAREMHDVLAHSLSGLMLQLEGARMLASSRPGDPRLPEIINRAHQLGKTGLDEARRAIGMLRDDELPGPERLAGLARQFELDRAVRCRLTISGEARRLSSDARLTLYRVAQEALTNITKHAEPERVELHLAYTSSVTRLVVEDFTTVRIGQRSFVDEDTDGENTDGYGLTGMRERAELLGGTLSTVCTGSGFRVEFALPLVDLHGPTVELAAPKRKPADQLRAMAAALARTPNVSDVPR